MTDWALFAEFGGKANKIDVGGGGAIANNKANNKWSVQVAIWMEDKLEKTTKR